MSRHLPQDLAKRQWLIRSGQSAIGFALIIKHRHALLQSTSTLIAVRLWPSPNYTRLTIESSRPLDVKHDIQPKFIAITVLNVENGQSTHILSSLVQKSDPYIQSVDLSEQNNTLVIRINLKQSVQYKNFALKPIAAYAYRTVFDFIGLNPITPTYLPKSQTPLPPKTSTDPFEPDELSRFIASLPTMAATVTKPITGTQPKTPKPKTTSIHSMPELVRRPPIIALDPGHGGEDPGAIGPSGLREKDVVLQIALQLRDQLTLAGFKVVMTRTGDYFVPLFERVQIARRANADLFMSIHADAFVKPTAKGASVFALSDKSASSQFARWLAERENQSDLVGGGQLSIKDQRLAKIVYDMSTTAQIQYSLKYGNLIIQALKSFTTLHKSQVEQAGFAVLKAPDIPSVLVETAFISNPEEEKKLASADYQQQLVNALFEGIHQSSQRILGLT